jgi:hypothetical protein
MATSTEISFGLFDVSAKPDSSPSCPDKQPFVDIDQLKLDAVTAPPSATLEPNSWFLDGTFSAFPDEPETKTFGLWSASISEANGAFNAPPVLTIEFTENHSSMGVSFEFDPYGDNHPNHINIKWYGSGGTVLLADEDFHPASWRYSALHTVENYDKLVITFYSMSVPYRYLKLQKINYGVLREFGPDEVIEAGILEEINPISAELSINTLNFRLYSPDGDFNILNPQGIYTLLQQRQPLVVTERINGASKPMGTFFLDEWENPTEHTFAMTAMDAIGIMDGTTYKGGIYKNLLTENQYGIETDTTGFTPYFSETIERDTTEHWEGTASLKIISNPADGDHIIKVVGPLTLGSSTGNHPLKAGEKITFSFYRKSDGTGRARARMVFKNASGGSISEVSAPNVAVPTSWERHVFTYTVPDGCAGAEVRISLNASGTVWVDNLYLGPPEWASGADLMADILTDAGFGYDIDSSYAAIPVYGWLPISSHREALQQVAFAVGAVVDTSRSDIIRVYPLPTSVSGTITKDRRFTGGGVKMRGLVTGVEVTAHNYVESSETVELFNGALAAGEHEITFMEPMHDLSISGATILTNNCNYARVNVASPGTVVLSGKRYVDTTQVYGVYMGTLPAGAKENILKVEEATLVSGANAQATAQRVYDYYQKRIEQTVSMVLGNEQVGQTVNVETLYNQERTGAIESLETDLTGGFRTKVVIVGE